MKARYSAVQAIKQLGFPLKKEEQEVLNNYHQLLKSAIAGKDID